VIFEWNPFILFIEQMRGGGLGGQQMSGRGTPCRVARSTRRLRSRFSHSNRIKILWAYMILLKAIGVIPEEEKEK
jgi:hypothetical protein